MNCLDFELLSAYADGEATPDECLQVNSHLKSCAACQATLTSLGHLSQGIQRPQPIPVPVRVRPPLHNGWWQRLQALSDSPVVHLVSLQRRRRARFGPLEMLKMMALFALPVFFMWLSPDRSPLTAFLLVSAVGLMVGLPLRQFSEEVALLASLRRGRCLEEILGTGTSAQGLLDGLAVQGLMQILRAALTVWPVLLVGTFGLPAPWQPGAWGVELLWLPCLVGFFLVGYYLAQFLQVRSGMLTSLILLCPWTLVLLGLPGCLVAGLLTAVMARRLAIHGLENPERVKAVPLHRRNPLVRSWSQNPIARREMSRLSAGMGGNWKRLALWRASMFLLPVAWAVWSLLAGLAHWPDVYASGLLLFSGLFFVRSAVRTLPSVVRERELQSWEILMQTPLGTRTFVHGWLQVCLYTVFTEGALAFLVLGGYICTAVSVGHQTQPLACLLVLPAASLLGAYVGLALSAASRTHRQASQSLMLWCLGGGLGWLLAWGLGQGVVATVWEPLGGFRDPLAVAPVLGELSLLALLPVGIFLAVRARVLLKKLPYSDPSEGQQKDCASRYSPVVACLDLASLLFLVYGLITWEAWQRQTDVSAMKGALLLLVAGLGWIFAVRLPLASLAEWTLGRRLSLLLGAVFGLFLSWTASLALLALSFKVGEPWWRSPDCTYGTIFACLVVGVACGGLAARKPSDSWERHEILRKRLLGSLLWLLALPFAWLTAVPQGPQEERRTPGLVVSPYSRQLLVLLELAERNPNQGSGRPGTKVPSPLGNLPNFGKAAARANKPFSDVSGNWLWYRLQPSLQEQAERYTLGDAPEKALNFGRWALLLQDVAPGVTGEGEMNWLLDLLAQAITRSRLSRTEGRELILQLQSTQAEQVRLVSGYQSYAYQSLYRGNYSPEMLDALLPRFYLNREREARKLGLARAAQLGSQFKLWELSREGGLDLIEDVPLAPLARQSLGELGVDLGIRALARQWSRREGLALLVGLQLYRQEHQGNWPASLEEVNQYLPRPARCYLNAEGSFVYRPGHLSCARADGDEPLLIYTDETGRQR